MKQEILLIILIGISFISLNYHYFDSKLIQIFEESEFGIVERVIDGDTIVINGTSIRLLGINSPEKGEILYEESKHFLENKTLNKTVKLLFQEEKYDKYRRKLAFVFIGKENINLESVKKGFSNIYFLKGKTKFHKEFNQAWKDCLNQNKNLCEKSNQFCIILSKWDIENQIVTLKNICNKEISLSDWSIKDEGRKKFIFQYTKIKSFGSINITQENFNEDYVWTKAGDSIFVRDEKNKLVLWESY